MSDHLRHKSIDGLSRKLAEFAQSFELAQAPAAVVNNAKLAILDCLGVSVLATSQEIGNCLSQFAKANVSPGNCSVWGMNIKASVRDAAFLNGTLAHGLDYDDRNHSTTYTLAASFATRPKVSTQPGRQALEAFIISPRSAGDVGSHLLGALERHRPRRTRLALEWHSRPHRRGLLGERAITD